ncbi:MAG: hypothetical protein ABIF17_03840 [Patescibacteria group bacterium]
MQKKNRLTNLRLQKVFSLVILLFLVILSILFFDYIIAKVRDQKRKADLRQIVAALDMYYDQYQEFPIVEDGDFNGWDATYEPSSDEEIFLDVLVEKNFIDHVPRDPINNSSYYYRYIRYPSGSYGCEKPFYVLQLSNFEQPEKSNGFGNCPEINFVDFAFNGYTIQKFE